MKTIHLKYISVKIICLLGCVAILSGCKKAEERLTPTETPEKAYILPQGNHDFDQRIVDYHKRWGSYLLYKFTDQDVQWNVTSNATFYQLVPAQEQYVSRQLDLLDQVFFKYYPDSTLKKYLPLKVFLCSSLKANYGSTTDESDAYLLSSNLLGGVESFGVNWGNAAVTGISEAQIKTFRANVNFSFLKMMEIKGLMVKSDLFLGLSNYTTPLTPTPPLTYVVPLDSYKRGFLEGGYSVPNSQADWYSYLKAIVSNPYSALTNPNTTTADVTAIGMLSPVKDVNGLVRLKYNAITTYFKNRFNIDLQKIGDGQ